VQAAVIGVLLVRHSGHSGHRGFLQLARQPYHTRPRMARQLLGCPVHSAIIVFVRLGDYNRNWGARRCMTNVIGMPCRTSAKAPDGCLSHGLRA
jgi:hypothetical protein